MALMKRLAKRSVPASPIKRAAKKGMVPTPHAVTLKPPAMKAPTPGHGSDQGTLPIGVSAKRLAKKTPKATPIKRLAKKGMR